MEIEHTFRRIGKRILLVSARLLGEVNLILMGVRDITERKRSEGELLLAERELRAANEALKRTNTDLMHFSYAVSHDLQEPLRMVISYTQLLERQLPDIQPPASQSMNFVIEGAFRMESLLSALREYWSISEHQEEIKSLDCNQALQKALSYLQEAIEETGAVVTHDTLPTIFVEEYPLTLLFQNLVGNAIKYHRPDTPPRVHVSADRAGTGWTFSVTDNGLGIEPQFLDVIFVPFRRLHGRKYAGTGLGLSMCSKIVERYHGKILVDSTPGEGSTFRFILPDPGTEL